MEQLIWGKYNQVLWALTDDRWVHIPLLTVRYTLMKVSPAVLSTPHQYNPESDNWSLVMFTTKTPFPQSAKLILPDSAFWPDCTRTSTSPGVLHGSLQKYLLFDQAKVCEHMTETSPLSDPWTSMLATSDNVKKKKNGQPFEDLNSLQFAVTYQKELTIKKTREDKNGFHPERWGVGSHASGLFWPVPPGFVH